MVKNMRNINENFRYTSDLKDYEKASSDQLRQPLSRDEAKEAAQEQENIFKTSLSVTGDTLLKKTAEKLQKDISDLEFEQIQIARDVKGNPDWNNDEIMKLEKEKYQIRENLKGLEGGKDDLN